VINPLDIWSPSEGQMKCFVWGHCAAYRTVENLGWMRFEFPEHSRVVIMRPDWNKMVVLDTETKECIWLPYPHEHTPAYTECKTWALFLDDSSPAEHAEQRLLPLDRSMFEIPADYKEVASMVLRRFPPPWPLRLGDVILEKPI